MTASSHDGPLIIAGPDARARLAEHPGIYVGNFPIPALLRLVGHTAIAASSDTGIVVTELVGWWVHLFQQIALHRPQPFYGDFSRYRWVRVAGPEALAAYHAATATARDAYHGRFYTASSNRFVSTVLHHAHIAPTREMLRAIGSAPGIRWRLR